MPSFFYLVLSHYQKLQFCSGPLATLQYPFQPSISQYMNLIECQKDHIFPAILQVGKIIWLIYEQHVHKNDIQNLDYAFKGPEVTSLAFYFLHDILESHSNQWGDEGWKHRSLYLTPGLPRWHTSKEPTCQCSRQKRCGFDLWVEKIPGIGNGNSLHCLVWKIPWPEELAGCSLPGPKSWAQLSTWANT